MNSQVRVGFIGFGEVASLYAAAIAPHAVEVIGYDALFDQPGGVETLRRRDRTGKIRFVALADLVREADYIFSTVTTSSAEIVARLAAKHLVAGKTYVDLNAASPELKRRLAAIVTRTGAHFVEGAILGAVGVTGARTRILVGDPAGPAVAEALARLGLHTVFHSAEIGRASMFKTLRSIFSKGLEALLIEYLVAGRRAGLQDELWREAAGLFSQNAFERVAANWVRTHAGAHDRRYHEMEQVTAEVRALGLEPVMTAATERFFGRSRTLDWQGLPAAADADDVVAWVEARLREQRPIPSKPDSLP